MKIESGILIGVCRPVPGVLSFLTPIFRDRSGAAVAQMVREGRIVSFAEVDLGEEFVPLRSSATATIGDPAVYGMEFEDCIAVASLMGVMAQNASGRVDWSDANAIRLAFETNRFEKLKGLMTFPRTGVAPGIFGDQIDDEETGSTCKPTDGDAQTCSGNQYQTARDGRERIRLVSEEAAYWYLLCVDDASLLRSDRREFLAWMRRSPQNIAELFKIAQLDGKLRRLEFAMRSLGLMKSSVVALTTSGSPYGPHLELKELDENEGKDSVNKRTLTFKMAAFAASLFFSVALAFVAHDYMQSDQVVTTGSSQWHHMTLPDGTAVHVDARSRVEVAYTHKERIVHVYEGSAVFDVAKDSARPFVARTQLIDAMAVGTRFGVSIDPGVTTTVSEGVVKVTSRGKSDGKAVLLKAGEELRVSDSSLISTHFAHVDAERKLQWANGLLVLGGLTVSEGVEQLNRRNRTQIVVDSPTLGARVIRFASVKVDSPESYARMVAREPGVRMMLDKENGVIRLSE